MVDTVNNRYVLTALGIDAYDSLRIIDNAIKMENFDTNKDILDDLPVLSLNCVIPLSAVICKIT